MVKITDDHGFFYEHVALARCNPIGCRKLTILKVGEGKCCNLTIIGANVKIFGISTGILIVLLNTFVCRIEEASDLNL